MELELSFEFFPAKTSEGSMRFLQTVQSLSTLLPRFFSVTFGAGGSTKQGTIDATRSIQRITSIPVAPHLSCIGFDRQALIDILFEYKSLGVNRLVALRGDLPSGMGASGKFKYAHELVSLIRETTQDYFHIEVAAYPEYHPQARTAMHDILNLKKKFEAGANSAITQYFFNPDAYAYFLDACAKQGMYLPIVPGIMPITHFSKLIHFSEVCGAEIPRWLYKRLEVYQDDVEAIKAFGIETITNLCQQLLAAGAPGLHFYTLNQADSCLQIINNLNLGVKTMANISNTIDIK